MKKSVKQKVKIREATIEDAKALCELSRQLGYIYPAEKIAERLAYLSDHGKDRIFVAQEADSLVGYIHLCPYRLLFEDPMVNVLALVVDENCRGQGIGKKLLACAEDHALNSGFTAMRLNSSDYRKEAHRFYEANGYTSKGQTRFLKTMVRR